MTNPPRHGTDLTMTVLRAITTHHRISHIIYAVASSEKTVRHHLTRLLARGLVEARVLHRKPNQSYPHPRYALSDTPTLLTHTEYYVTPTGHDLLQHWQHVQCLLALEETP